VLPISLLCLSAALIPIQSTKKQQATVSFFFQVILPTKRSDVAHQTSDLLEFEHDHIPLFLVLLYFVLTSR
jgi:hypothetical protein